LLDQLFLRRLVCRRDLLGGQHAALQHGDGDLRPADVDADEPIAHPSSLAAAGSHNTNNSPAFGRTWAAGDSGSAGSPNARFIACALSCPVTRKTTRRAALSAGSVSEIRGTCGSIPASGTPVTSRRRSNASSLPGNSEATCASAPSPSSSRSQ